MKESILGVVLSVCLLFGCSFASDSNPLEWVPDSLPTESGEMKESGSTVTDETEDIQNTMNSENLSMPENLELHTTEELLDALEDPNGKDLADMLWDNQRISGLYNCSLAMLEEKNLLTYYVSFSEGNDNNSGRTPDEPKKTLNGFSGISNVNILLKCGDIFPMADTFNVGSNVTIAAYGEGARPILDYYQQLDVSWTAVAGCSDVWSANLSGVAGLYNGTLNKSDCNIGHLVINGESNWKRLVKADNEDYVYPQYLAEQKDGGFAVDWEQSVIYLYSKTDPNQLEISYALPQHAMNINNVTRTEIMGIELRGAGFHGISMNGVSEITISNCYIHHIGGGLLKDRGPRYGNAVEVWDSGSNVTVTYNMAEWIYDTCYTNQGSTSSMVQEDILFARNLGRYSFWGIETWGDGGSVNEFKNIVYEENLMMYACDLTNKDVAVYVNEKEQVMDADGTYYSKYPAYHTYRGSASSYPYNQMSLLNAANAKTKESLAIKDNLFWGTNRVLTMLKTMEDGEIRFILEDNAFYAVVPSDACVFRYTDVDNKRIFMKDMPIETNTSLVQIKGAESEELQRQAKQVLSEKLNVLANGVK